MPTTYDKADGEINALVASVMRKYHGDLTNAGVSVQVLTAHNPDGPAVKLRGWPCAATIRRTNLKQRVAGNADSEMIIDSKTWEDLSQPERVALIDHELTHLELKLDRNGRVETDDASRPKLLMRLHDYELSGFKEVMERHEGAALEVQNAVKWQTEYEQMLLSYAERG